MIDGIWLVLVFMSNSIDECASANACEVHTSRRSGELNWTVE